MAREERDGDPKLYELMTPALARIERYRRTQNESDPVATTEVQRALTAVLGTLAVPHHRSSNHGRGECAACAARSSGG